MSIFLCADENRTEEKDGYEIPSFALCQPVQTVQEYDGDLAQLIRRCHRNNFLKTLFGFIDARGRKDTEVYKAALVERRYFSKIRSGRIPKKHTVVALGLALQLNPDEMNALLQSAGYAFTDTRKEDIIIRWCLQQKIFSVMEVNEILEDHNAHLLR